METQPNFKTDFTLSKYWEQINRAHSNISFSPERRADMYVRDYSEELDEDLAQLGENQGNYKEKYERYFSAWMSAKGNCISSAITGPANFPVRKAEKANNSERNRYDEFRHWREKYFKAVNRVRTPSPEEDLENLYKELDGYLILNENIKEWNKSIRKYKNGKMTIEEMRDQLKKDGITDRWMTAILRNVTYSYWHGLGSFATKIRKLRERAEALKSRIQRKEEWTDIEFEGGRITVEDDRVKIYHDEKPSPEIIGALKRHGFRWSPYWGAWSRKHTGQAVYDAKMIVNLKS